MDTLKGIDHVTNTNILVRDEIVAWFEAETAAGRQISPPETGRIRQEGSR
jgi:hypothetical protein